MTFGECIFSLTHPYSSCKPELIFLLCINVYLSKNDTNWMTGRRALIRRQYWSQKLDLVGFLVGYYTTNLLLVKKKYAPKVSDNEFQGRVNNQSFLFCIRHSGCTFACIFFYMELHRVISESRWASV